MYRGAEIFGMRVGSMLPFIYACLFMYVQHDFVGVLQSTTKKTTLSVTCCSLPVLICHFFCLKL